MNKILALTFIITTIFTGCQTKESYEIRFTNPEARKVVVSWAVDDWNPNPDYIQEFFKELFSVVAPDRQVMYTEMEREGNDFVATIEMPVDTFFRYAFLVTKDRNGDEILEWDGNYHSSGDRLHTVQEQNLTRLVPKEIHYYDPDAVETKLSWGIKGVGKFLVPGELQSGFTTIEKGMLTTMQKNGNDFSVTLLLPENADINYMVQVYMDDMWGDHVRYWDGGYGGYESPADTPDYVVDGTLLHYDPVKAYYVEPNTQLVTKEIHYHRPEAGRVTLVWGVNGRRPIPSLVSESTIIKNDSMHTVMERAGEDFVAVVQAPVGLTINYGFLMTQDQNGTEVNKWDGGYVATADKDDVVAQHIHNKDG